MNAKELAASIYARLKDGDRHVEEQRVDLKSKWYAFGGTGGANADEEFAKDVCAMANAGVIAPAYLLFGLSPEPPHLCPAGLPLDEASLQQKLGSKIAPPPTVAFEEFVLDGARISTATIIGQAEHLPYGARRNDGWTYWVRFGSSTRPATPHDIESLFRLRYQARQRPEPRIVIPDGKLVWSHHFDTASTAYRWHPPKAAPPPRQNGASVASPPDFRF